MWWWFLNLLSWYLFLFVISALCSLFLFLSSFGWTAFLWLYFLNLLLAICLSFIFLVTDLGFTLCMYNLPHTASVQFSSVQSPSHVQLFATPWIAAQQASLSITNSRSLPKLMSIESVMPSSHLILCRPLLLLPPIPPSIRVFCNESSLPWGGQSTGVHLQHQSFQWTPRTDLLQNGLVGSPCSPRDSQESSPTPQFKSINSSALSFLHSPTLTSIHDHWKNHSLD